MLVPHRPPRSPASRLLGWITLPCVAAVAGVDALLTALGMPGVERPTSVQIILALAAAAPAVLWYFSPQLGSVPGFGWLADRSPISLLLDEHGLRLRRGMEDRFVAWDEVSRVVVVDAWAPSAALVLRDGERISLPGEFVTARRADGAQTSLLEEIERYRPDLSRIADRRREARAVAIAAIGIAVVGVVGLYLLTR